jgi:hypothetical protein
MEYLRYCPGKIFETPKDGICAPVTFEIELAAATANQSVVAAVASKVILVLALTCETEGAATYCTLKNGSAGVRLHNIGVPAITVGVAEPRQFNPAGWALTSVNTALVADTGAVITRLSITYIIYTP